MDVPLCKGPEFKYIGRNGDHLEIAIIIKHIF